MGNKKDAASAVNKITNRDIVTANAVMPLFMSVSLPASMIMPVMIAQKRVGAAFDLYEKARVKLAEQHARNGSDGKPVKLVVDVPERTDDEGRIVTPAQHGEKFDIIDPEAWEKEYQAQLDQPAEFDPPAKIDLAKLGGAKFAPAVIMALSFLFKDL